MKWHRRRRWMTLAALTLGTTLQLSTCQQEAALLGIRTAFTSFTLPFNQLIRQFLLGF